MRRILTVILLGLAVIGAHVAAQPRVVEQPGPPGKTTLDELAARYGGMIGREIRRERDVPDHSFMLSEAHDSAKLDAAQTRQLLEGVLLRQGLCLLEGKGGALVISRTDHDQMRNVNAAGLAEAAATEWIRYRMPGGTTGPEFVFPRACRMTPDDDNLVFEGQAGSVRQWSQAIETRDKLRNWVTTQYQSPNKQLNLAQMLQDVFPDAQVEPLPDGSASVTARPWLHDQIKTTLDQLD